MSIIPDQDNVSAGTNFRRDVAESQDEMTVLCPNPVISNHDNFSGQNAPN